MLEQWGPVPEHSSMSFRVYRYPTGTILDALTDAPGAIEITQYVQSITQTYNEATFKLHWHMELYPQPYQPQMDEVVKIEMLGRTLWIGIIHAIVEYAEARGERSMRFVARSRDAFPPWRDVRASTSIYSRGSDLYAIIDEIVTYAGLAPEEFLTIGATGRYTMHDGMQMHDMMLWDMLTILGQPTGGMPYIDAFGRLKFISRDTTRPPDRYITKERLVRVGDSKSKPRVTRVSIKWLSPYLVKTQHQDQPLGGATITAGFFQRQQDEDVYFSDDRSLRVENTRMVIKQTCNSGLLRVAEERYRQRSDYHGRVTLTTHAWVPVLATSSVVGLFAASFIPDGVVSFGGGITIPKGRVVHAGLEVVIMTIMMSIGTGVYEIWGTPYDYVYETNTTEAFDDSAPPWVANVLEISNDFVLDENVAQQMAVRELLYHNLESRTFTVTIVDDPSIEVGDILQLPNGARMYVTSYSREIARGAAHLLNVQGFRV